MKKFLVIIFLGLLCYNFSFASDIEKPKYDTNNFNNNIIKYKWKHTETADIKKTEQAQQG